MQPVEQSVKSVFDRLGPRHETPGNGDSSLFRTRERHPKRHRDDSDDETYGRDRSHGSTSGYHVERGYHGQTPGDKFSENYRPRNRYSWSPDSRGNHYSRDSPHRYSYDHDRPYRRDTNWNDQFAGPENSSQYRDYPRRYERSKDDDELRFHKRQRTVSPNHYSSSEDSPRYRESHSVPSNSKTPLDSSRIETDDKPPAKSDSTTKDSNNNTQEGKHYVVPYEQRIIKFTAKELEERKRHFGSTLSIIDRRKFEKEFNVSSLNLSDNHLKIYHDNPHIRQVFANRRQFMESPTPLGIEHRVVSDATGRTTYCRRMGEAKTVDHWGQRKLLMSEIEFLSQYSENEEYLVIYAGAAPGTHTNYLASELFPKLRWVLIDPARFDARETDRIRIINGYFTDELAHKYSDKELYPRVLFISDIRSMSPDMPEDVKEKCIVHDMQLQRNWHNIMKPKATMLKFRLPYTAGKTHYLKGEIHMPVWGGRTTTETRLFVTTTADETVEYCHTDYEDLMFHHNTITRTTYFPHDITGEGLDHCFDCASEIFILSQYLSKFQSVTDPAQLRERVAQMSHDISRKISLTHRTLKVV